MSRLGQRLDRQYEVAIAELRNDYESGEITQKEWGNLARELKASHDRAVDSAAENLKEYGR